jgi:hypothetical protein
MIKSKIMPAFFDLYLFVLLAEVALLVSCANRPPPSPRPFHDLVHTQYSELAPPKCSDERPRRRRTPLQHSCWEWGDRSYRSISASCRIDTHGQLECWRDRLKPVPKGAFVQVDDDGYDACAIDERGMVACWGFGDRGESWTQAPKSDPYVSVVLAKGTSPMALGRAYACGLTIAHGVHCWEKGGNTFELPGKFVAVEPGDSIVCGINFEGQLECIANTIAARPQKNSEKLSAISLGLGASCLLTAESIARCSMSIDLGNWVQDNVAIVRTGFYHACALLRDGQITCHGDARPPPQGFKFRYLTRSGYSDGYCGITLDGKVLCWGDPAP